MAWKDSGDGSGGNWYKPAPGMYRGKFIGTEETTRKKYQSEEIEDAFRWKFEVFDMASGAPLYYVNAKDVDGNTASQHVPEGTPESERAIADFLTSTATGQRSKGREYLGIFEGAKIEGALTGAEFARRLATHEGKEVYITFGPNKRISSFIPIGPAAQAA